MEVKDLYEKLKKLMEINPTMPAVINVDGTEYDFDKVVFEDTNCKYYEDDTHCDNCDLLDKHGYCTNTDREKLVFYVRT